MKKQYEYLNQLTLKSLEEKQKINFETFNQKFSELNKKFDTLIGNNTEQNEDKDQEQDQDDSSNENDMIKSEKEKSENEEEEKDDNNNKPKIMNLSEINAHEFIRDKCPFKDVRIFQSKFDRFISGQ